MRALVWTSTPCDAWRRTLLGFAVVVAAASAGSATTITLRSGNAPIGQPDPLIRYLVEPSGSCGVGFPNAFTAADFAAASAGPNAHVVANYPVWIASLPCDPLARWIAPNANRSPRSALFAYEFVVPDPCCIQRATLDFCWAQDDWLGDLDTFTNPGVFLNGTAYPVTGGNFVSETHASVDVTASLHCGVNTLYVYNRDAACVVSGLIFSATITIEECVVAVRPDTWGRVKALYR